MNMTNLKATKLSTQGKANSNRIDSFFNNIDSIVLIAQCMTWSIFSSIIVDLLVQSQGKVVPLGAFLGIILGIIIAFIFKAIKHKRGEK